MLPKFTETPSFSNRPLRASEREEQLRLKLRKQTWLRTGMFLIMLIIVWVIDSLFVKSGLLITKSLALGALVNWVAQSLFTWYAFRLSGGHRGRQIVNQLYAGQLLKWLVVLIGFSAIFIGIKSLSAGAVLVGFITMQICNFIILIRFR